jgi:hypothetical protein
MEQTGKALSLISIKNMIFLSSTAFITSKGWCFQESSTTKITETHLDV